jgi:hypothetical protein
VHNGHDFDSTSTISGLRAAKLLEFLDDLPPEKRFPFVKEYRKYLQNSINLATQKNNINPAALEELLAIKNSRIWRYTSFWRKIRSHLD